MTSTEVEGSKAQQLTVTVNAGCKTLRGLANDTVIHLVPENE